MNYKTHIIGGDRREMDLLTAEKGLLLAASSNTERTTGLPPARRIVDEQR